MRAPTPQPRPARRPRRHGGLGLPVGLATALAFAAATVGLASSAAALPDVELIVNGRFDSYPWIWGCESTTSRSTVPHEHYMTGRPTAESYAGCTQRVRVQPNSSYTLSASVRGPYVFVGVTGTVTGTAATWSHTSDWNDLSVRITTGPATTDLTVYVHGWYGQDPYSVRTVSFTGPGIPPSPCGGSDTAVPTTTGGSTLPGPTPSCSRTYIP
ncbi:carbohydrate binding domain-containing protein [Kitasatospora sp. NPDC059327]|uniref:carbohydrate binding domain-containing protein n=1 Tax=Kitasatospora sp. NPDC059327 TaxID=3346803 RepID=UPI0036A94361